MDLDLVENPFSFYNTSNRYRCHWKGIFEERKYYFCLFQI